MVFNKYRTKQVFISSRCDSREEVEKSNCYRYTHIRRELQILLESTGLFTVYNFDEEGASSSDVRSQYLGELEGSDIAIFFVDNKDGVSNAVLEEKRRAEECGLQQLYFFCDQYQPEPTQLQEEVKNTHKYQVVNKFTEMAEAAFTSLIQNIIDIYCRKKTGETAKSAEADSENEEPVFDKNITSQGNKFSKTKTETGEESKKGIIRSSFIDKTLCAAPKRTKEFIWNWITGNNTSSDIDDSYTQSLSEDNIFSSEIEEAITSFLKGVLCLEDFDTASFNNLSDWIISKQNAVLKELLRHRLLAIEFYCLGDIESAVKEEREALLCVTSSNDEVFPAWLVNDIAIDLRNLITYKELSNGKLKSFGEEGQRVINFSEEYVHYPIVDRMLSDGKEYTIRCYETMYTASPFTITSDSNLTFAIGNYVDAFWVALLHGSFIHTMLIATHLTEILKYVVNVYDGHIPVVELIRLSCINGNKLKDNLDYIERTYHSNTELLNPDECISVYESIRRIPLKKRRNEVEWRFLAKFLFYLRDDGFDEIHETVLEETRKKGSLGCVNLIEAALSYYAAASQREKVDDALDFAMDLLQHDKSSGILERIASNYSGTSYENADEDKLLKLVDAIIETLRGTQNKKTDSDDGTKKVMITTNISNLLLTLAKTNVDADDRISTFVRAEMPSFYENIYLNEMNLGKNRKGENVEVLPYIKHFLEKIVSQNESVSIGSFSLNDSCLSLLRIMADRPSLKKSEVSEILEVMLSVLSNEDQLVMTKVNVCEIIVCIFRYYSTLFTSEERLQYIFKLADNKQSYVICNSSSFITKDKPVLLEYAYNLMLLSFSDVNLEDIQSVLFSVGPDDSYTQIMLLHITTEFLKSDCEYKASDNLLEAFLLFCLSARHSREKAVQFNCVRVLVELSKYRKTFDMAMKTLLTFMDSGNAVMRAIIVSRVVKEEKDDNKRAAVVSKRNKYVKAIRQKASLDYNYLVRKWLSRVDG